MENQKGRKRNEKRNKVKLRKAVNEADVENKKGTRNEGRDKGSN